MLDRVKLELLKQAVERDDWVGATEVFERLSLTAQGTDDRFYTEALSSAVRLREPEWLSSILFKLSRSSPD
jgi:hypothetical protein